MVPAVVLGFGNEAAKRSCNMCRAGYGDSACLCHTSQPCVLGLSSAKDSHSHPGVVFGFVTGQHG